MSTDIALQKKLSDVIAEYNNKLTAVPATIAAFKKAGSDLELAACVSGTFGNTSIDTGRVYESTIQQSLLKSAWLHVYKGLNIERIASAEDKRRFEQAMQNPVEFTLDNIRATFGDFIIDPWGNILRGLAEVFCSLDQAYKSHDKVKIGVKGLPKRVIVSGFNSWSGYGKDRLENILNALAAYQGKPLVTYQELDGLLKDGDCMLKERTVKSKYDNEAKTYPARGVWLKRFQNGNGHLFFTPDTLRDINMALAKYYGEVLPDCSEDKPTKNQASTAVSKDLQYYPTPVKVVDRVVRDLYIQKGDRVLEPSCGCGRFLDALRRRGATVLGFEVDAGRANQCRDKGHNVIIGNFLDSVPTGDFDRVVMNPPFYGKHYVKHVEHALKFLKPDGVLTAILPATARYDHGLLSGQWSDLPIGSFSESGTNVNTTVLMIRNKV